LENSWHADVFIGPSVSTAMGAKRYSLPKLAYFSSLREAASSAAAPASRADPVTYDSARGHMTVTVIIIIIKLPAFSRRDLKVNYTHSLVCRVVLKTDIRCRCRFVGAKTSSLSFFFVLALKHTSTPTQRTHCNYRGLNNIFTQYASL